MAFSKRSNPIINSRRLAVLLASTALAASPATAATYSVTDEASLVAAINSANASAGSDTIVFANAITLTGTLPTITDITTVDAANYQLSMPSGSLTFSGAGTLNLANGGQVTGSGVGNSVTFGSGLATLNVASGATIDGNISAATSGAINVTTSGSLNGTLLGSNNADTLAINGGSFGGATLGNGNDVVTFRGGTIAGTINGGGGSFGGDRFTAAIGSGNTASLDLTNLRSFGGYALTSGTLAMSGVGQTQADWTVTSGASVNLSGALHGYNWSLQVSGNNSGSAVNITPTGSIDGYVGVWFNGAPTNSLTNAGSISTTQVAVTTNGRTTINNSGTIASSTADGISTGFSAATIVNSGTISGSTSGVTARYSAINVTNQAGGLINGTTVGFLGGSSGYGGLDTLTNASGAGITGATAISIAGNSGLTLNNSGQVIGSTTAISTAGSGAVNIANNAGGIIANGTLASAGATYVSGTGTAITVRTGGTISNAGTIAGTTAIDFTGAGTITNLSGGVISGTTGVSGSGLVNLNFNAGSTADGVTLTGSGQRNVAINGTIGAFDASTATGSVNVTVGATATLASLALGSGNDTFTNNGATITGAVNGSAGTDTYAIAVATGQSRTLDLGSALTGTTNFELLGKTGGGTLTVNGTLDPSIQGIIAGDGGNNDGLLIFDGTSGLTAAIIVNGAIIRANSAGAFGTGTITTIDPTIQYAATGTYSNNIVLAVPAPASGDPTRLEALNGSTATLTGAITSDPTADANQYVTIGGNGTIVLTNNANLWTGVTAIDSGATLQGASDTISGSSVADNGLLAFNQSASGTFATSVSGPGLITVAGLAPGNTLTLSGPLTQIGNNLGAGVSSNGLTILDASRLTLSGGYTGAAIGLGASGATLTNLNTIDTTGAASGFQDGVHSAGSGGTVVNGVLGESTPSTIIGGASGVINYSGSGDLAVTNFGRIQGVGFDGVTQHGAGSLTVTNNANAIIYGQNSTGSNAGYGVASDGGGALTLTNAAGGEIVGRLGVYATSLATITNSGLIGAGTLTGTTFSYGNGADGIQALGGGTVDNLAGGQILGSASGIYAANAPLAVTNGGTIHGNQYGVRADSALTLTNFAGGSVDGTTTGLRLNANGNVVTNSGSITGNEAIRSNGSIDLTNNLGGTVSGTAAAFNLIGVGAGTITNSGDLINGVVSTGGGNLTIDNHASGNIVRVVFGSAIDLSNGGRLTLTNAGDIVGSGWGVVGRNTGDSITNSGRIASGTISGNTITVSGNDAIVLFQGGTVTNLTGGQITGRNTGITGGAIMVDNRSGALISGTNAVAIGNGSSVTNAGTITGGTANGNSGVQVAASSIVTNLASGSITGARATQFNGAGDVLNNSGAITSTAATASQGYGALFFSGGTVNNFAGGTITGSYRGVSIQGTAGNVTNAGTIASTAEVALLMFNGGTVTNQAGGLIDGQYRGVYIGGAAGTVTNAGTIRATVDNAVSLFAGGTVNNQLVGTLSAMGGGGWGIYGTGGALNLTNAGTINADTGIVTNANGAIVTNSGTINGTVNGVMSFVGTSQSLTNSGTITATNSAGVNAGGGLTLNNSGTIRTNASGLSDGVMVFNAAAASIVNSGTISAATASAIAVTGASKMVNSGTLTGGSDVTNGYGVQFAVGSSGSFVNQSGGTVGGGAGSIVLRTDNAVSIDLQAGSSANGAILSAGSGARNVNVAGSLNGVYNASAGTGTDTFTLASTGSIGGALLGSGNDSFTSFGGAIGGAVDGGAGSDVLTFDVGGTASYDAGLFANFETRLKINSGTLTLTGVDAMTNDFALNGGTLVLLGGSALNDAAALVTASGTTTRIVGGNEQVRTISGAGAIDLGANTLTLGGNDTSTYSGVIGGTGSLAKSGTGVLTLTGANSYSGLTQVSGGVLRLGASNVIANASIVSVASGATFDLAGFNDTIGGLTGAGTVALGSGRLTVDQATNSVLSGPITGSGSLTKLGLGRLDLSGASTYTGATLVNGGTLAVNGSLVSAVTVDAGGKLGGNGSVGGLSILSGGILAPGNSIGHLTVNGNLSFAAGSIYQVEITPTAADSTGVTGNITIGGGTVQVLATGTAYDPLTRYTILDSLGTVSGTFANVTSNLAFLTPGIEYNPQSVVLVVRRNNINFTDVAANPNQVAVAGAVQSLGSGPLYDAVLVQSAGGARQAYDALSGEIYASSQTAILGQRDRLQDAMASNRLRSDGMGLWLDVGKSWGSYDQSGSRGNAIASTDTSDLLGGFNWARGPLAVTLAGGRVIDKIEVEDCTSKAKAKSWLFGGQLTYGANLGLHAVAGGNYASHKVTTDRSIAFPGFVDATSSSRNGNGYHLFGQLGYASQTAGITLEPFVGLARDRLKLDALSETGGLAALDIRAASRSLTTTQLGLKLASTANLGWANFTPRASVAWQHVMGERGGKMEAGFQAGGSDYAATGSVLSRDSAKVAVDLDLEFGRAKFVFGYSGLVGSVATHHTAKLGVQVRF